MFRSFGVALRTLTALGRFVLSGSNIQPAILIVSGLGLKPLGLMLRE